MEVKVLDINGKETGRKVQLSDSVFRIEPNKHAVYFDVKQYLLIKDKVLTKLKKELRLQEVLVKLKTKRYSTARAGSAKILCLKEEEQFWTKTKKLLIQIEQKLKRLAQKISFVFKVKSQI